MLTFKRFTSLVFFILGLSLLAACDTAEERAQKHYEKGIALLEEGEVERALLEFRNVFKLDGYHKDARLAYARVEEGRGNVSQAYGQYLRLVEQDPENLAGRRALSRLAVQLNNWEEVERHVTVAEKLAPQDPVVLSVRAGLDYRNALRSEDGTAAGLAFEVAQSLLTQDPALFAARRVVIDNLLRHQDWRDALDAVDAGLKQDPEDQLLQRQRLGLLEKLGRDDEFAAQLKDLARRYPDEGLHQTLVNWYVGNDRTDAAEAYLRERASAGDATPVTRMELVSFLAQTAGHQAARDEIDRILAGEPESPALFRSVRAGLDFDAGNREAAIIEMENILDGAEPSEETDRIRVALARMQIRTGNSIGARALVEEVLEHDPTQVDALKMKAGWLIEDDQTGDALLELRQALDQSPRDAETLILMALAHERAGDRELMGEMLALAVDASGRTPETSLRYVQFLLQDDKLLSAEDVLQDALRLQNTNPALLNALGNVYIRMEDWSRAQHVIDRLESIGTEAAAGVATELTARKLAGQSREEELQSFLGQLAESEDGLQAAASIVRLRLAQGDVSGAMTYVNELLQENPDDPSLLFIQASVLGIDGQIEQAAGILRALAAEYPRNERVWVTLYNLYRSRGDLETATGILQEGQAALPDSAALKWALAGEAELAGDIPAAIAIYEDLYETNSGSLVIANNLASLISTYRQDDESLQRAFAIARRLRGTRVAPFMDTYGWIAHRLGNHEEALEYLKPAADLLPDDPTVRFHLAEIYTALKRDSEALENYLKVAELAGSGGAPLPFMDRVTSRIGEIEAASQPDQTQGQD